MSDWESAPSNDGWENADGWESAGTPIDWKKEIAQGVLRNPLVGIADTAASLVTGAFGSGIQGPLTEAAADFRGLSPNEQKKAGAQAAENATWQPRTEMGQAATEHLGNFMNNIGIPALAPIKHPMLRAQVNRLAGPIPKPLTSSEIKGPVSIKDTITSLKQEPIVETKPPIPPEAQMELPDAAMAVAPQYGIHEGMGRVDENGMPIRADLSMDAQNVQNPLQRNLWGDELPIKTGDGGIPLTQAIDKMPDTPWVGPRDEAIGQLSHDIPADEPAQNAVGEANYDGLTLPLPDEPTSGTGDPVQGMGRSQRGGLNLDGIAEGIRQMASGTARALGLEPKAPAPDSLLHPRTPETIAERQNQRTKVEASALLKKIAPEYSDVSTPEEAITLAKDAKDINKNPLRDNTISGINGQVMNARNNPVMNFTRYALQAARNASTEFSKTYITKDKTGVATTYSKLSKDEKVQAVEILRESATQKFEHSPENLQKLTDAFGLNERQVDYMKSVGEAMDAMWERANDYTMSQRGKPMQKVPGYLPAIFNGSYKSLVGTFKDGRFVTETVVQADTKWAHDKVVKELKAQGKDVVTQPRVGLSGMSRKSDLFNGFNDIINVLAKEDPRFADIQALTNQRLNDANHTLMNFNVHELHKKGVKGSLGDKPWLSREQNAKELGKAVIDYLEQGADYYSHQGALNDIGKVLTDPDVRANMPNTAAVVQQHIKHVTGQDLSPIGAALNYSLDFLPKVAGLSYKIPADVARTAKNWMSLHLMGLYNPAFMVMQWTQPLTTAYPEMLKLRSKLEMSPVDMQKTIQMSPLHYTAMKYAKLRGLDTPPGIPEHMAAAFDWAQKHGIMDFSEMEIAHSATRNKALNTVENIGSTPQRLGESFTRPPVFMIFADMFHKFGLDNDEAFRSAQHATNIGMGDYHPAERPKIYAQLGITGEFAGALTTYKHNLLTNSYLHLRDAATKDTTGKRQYAPVAAALATAYMLNGVTGLPGYDDLDAGYQWITSQFGDRKTIRESVMTNLPEALKSDLLSASTGLDFQTRLSNSRVLPEVKGASLSPQLAALFDIIGKSHDYAKYKDKASYNAWLMAMAPSGMKGMVQDSKMTTPEGYVTNAAGEQMFDTPRTDNERSIRKWTAIKPLRESIEQKDVYADALNVTEKDKTQKDLAKRWRQAYVSGDDKGMGFLAQKFYDNGGDAQELLSDSAIQNQLVRSNQSGRERLTGKLQANMRSLNRWRDMHDGE